MNRRVQEVVGVRDLAMLLGALFMIVIGWLGLTGMVTSRLVATGLVVMSAVLLAFHLGTIHGKTSR